MFWYSTQDVEPVLTILPFKLQLYESGAVPPTVLALQMSAVQASTDVGPEIVTLVGPPLPRLLTVTATAPLTPSRDA